MVRKACPSGKRDGRKGYGVQLCRGKPGRAQADKPDDRITRPQGDDLRVGDAPSSSALYTRHGQHSLEGIHNVVNPTRLRSDARIMTSLPPVLPVTFADIQRAAETIAGEVEQTPAHHSRTLSRVAGTDIFLKFEN